MSYLCRVHGVKLVPVEVDVETHVFASLQDGAGGTEVKHTLLTEHIDVVDPQSSSGYTLTQLWQLHLQDVLCRLGNSLTPR